MKFVSFEKYLEVSFEFFLFQINYINKYHRNVYEILSEEMKNQRVEPSLLGWLEKNTQPI